MPSPRFSVVIPTRERADTLRFSLQTCLSQDFEDFEVVVCDNFSSPATRAVVDSCGSAKVRYVRAPEPLAMSANWELAVSHAAGEYITVLGDDDGLMPFALRELDRLLQLSGARAVRWDAAFYLWPTVHLRGQENFLRLPLGRSYREVDGCEAIRAVIDFRAEYTELPMLYNGVIHRDLVGRLRASAGRVFGGAYPDLYSGFAFGYLAGSYTSTEVPMSVAGISHQSNGVATLFRRGRHPVAHDYRTLNARSGFAPHRWVPHLPIFPAVPVADSFQWAKEALFPDDPLSLDRKVLAERCVAGIVADDADEWHEAFAVIRAACADDAGLAEWFDTTFAGCVPVPAQPPPLRSPLPGFQGNCLHLNADEFGVADVAGAARLCASLVGYGPGGIAFSRARPGLIRESDVLHYQLLEKEAVIRELVEAAEARLRMIEDRERLIQEQRRVIERQDHLLAPCRRLAKFPQGVYRVLRAAVRKMSGSGQLTASPEQGTKGD